MHVRSCSGTYKWEVVYDTSAPTLLTGAVTDHGRDGMSKAEPLVPPVPHPMNCLRPTEYVSHCKVCGGWTNYVCASCGGGISYCSPFHLEQVSVEHSTTGGRVHNVLGQDWPTHWRECDGSGGVSEQDALLETVEIMADDMLSGLSLTNGLKRADGGGQLKPALSGKTAGGLSNNKTTGLYADPSKGASQYTVRMALSLTKEIHPQMRSRLSMSVSRCPTTVMELGLRSLSHTYLSQREECLSPLDEMDCRWTGRWSFTFALMTTHVSATRTRR